MSSIYRKGEVLGWGSLAVVYRGWDELLDRPVAIKELKQPFAGSEHFCRAFRAQAMKQLDVSSRYMLATHTVDVDRGALAVVRELAEETVGQRSFQGPLESEAVIQLLRQVLAGLDTLHGRGLVHRAVKPENIFICGGDYKIGDFGLPAVEGAPAYPLSRYRYSSPEELSEPDRSERSSDLYSLGLVAYELILGPLRLTQVVEEILQDQERNSGSRAGEHDEIWPRFHLSTLNLPPIHELEPGVPAVFSLTLQKMVSKDLSSRFANCKKVLASLGNANPGELPTGSQRLSIAVNIPAVAGAGSPIPSASSAKWAWAGGGALVAASLVAAAIWVSGERSQVRPVLSPPVERGTESVTPKPLADDSSTPVSGSAGRLLRLSSSTDGLAVGLEPSLGPGRPRLTVGTPVRFRVRSNRGGHLLLFALSPDGSITCLYPNGRRAVAIAQGDSLVLPSEEDRQAGLELEAQAPLGRELVFAMVSSRDLPPLPAAAAGSLLREYPPGEPARAFTDWLERFFRENSQETRMAVLDLEIGAAQ